MADISTDRLEPTAPAIAPAERKKGEGGSPKTGGRRAPRPKAPEPEEGVPPEGPPHKVDQMA